MLITFSNTETFKSSVNFMIVLETALIHPRLFETYNDYLCQVSNTA